MQLNSFKYWLRLEQGTPNLLVNNLKRLNVQKQKSTSGYKISDTYYAEMASGTLGNNHLIFEANILDKAYLNALMTKPHKTGKAK